MENLPYFFFFLFRFEPTPFLTYILRDYVGEGLKARAGREERGEGCL